MISSVQCLKQCWVHQSNPSASSLNGPLSFQLGSTGTRVQGPLGALPCGWNSTGSAQWRSYVPQKKKKERQGAGVSIAILKHQRKQGADLLFRQVALI